MTTYLHITQIVDRIEKALALGSVISRSDAKGLELLLPDCEGSPLHRPMAKLIDALRREKQARGKSRIVVMMANLTVERRIEGVRAALAKHARDVAASSAGIELHHAN